MSSQATTENKTETVETELVSETNTTPPPEEKKAEEKKIEPKNEVLVKIDNQGGLVYRDHKELASAANLAIKMNFAPDHLKKEGVEAVMSCLMLCSQLNLPMVAMNEMGYVKGKATVFGTLFGGLAQRHAEYGEKRVFFIDDNQDEICSKNKNLKLPVWACVIQIKKKTSSVWNEYYFTRDEAAEAGLLTDTTKKDSGWIKYTKDLLYHKTKARAYRSEYSAAVSGVLYHEDVKEALIEHSAREVGPQKTDVAGDLNNLE